MLKTGAVVNQPSCPHTLGLTTKLTTAPVFNILYQTGKTVIAGSGQEVPARTEPGPAAPVPVNGAPPKVPSAPAPQVPQAPPAPSSTAPQPTPTPVIFKEDNESVKPPAAPTAASFPPP